MTARSERFGFVDQHDRYAVFHWVDQTARMANQDFGGTTVLEFSLALGTNQDLKQLRSEGHVDSFEN
jgi:hypothetical protein